METFGLVLTDIRTRQGLSFRALAYRAGVDHATVMKLEAGQRHPTVETVRRLANGLGLSEGAVNRDRLFLAAGFVPAGIDVDAMVDACQRARGAGCRRR